MDKTPKDHVLDALRTGDGKQITAYLNKYYKDVVGYYRVKTENEGSGGKVEGQEASNTTGGNRITNGQNVLGGMEGEVKRIFGQ